MDNINVSNVVQELYGRVLMSLSISIVIPAFNEEKYIATCLASIEKFRQLIPSDIEVIVANNDSTDNTSAIAKQFSCDVLDLERGPVSSARNRGAAHASGDLIAFVDGDVELTESWFIELARLSNQLTKHSDLVTGKQCLVPDNGTWIEKHWFKNLKDQYLGGANIVTTRTTFNALNGFDEKLKTGEDYDYCLRAIKENKNYQVNEKLNAIHLGFPHSLKDFMRRELWHGEGDFRSFSQFKNSIVAQIAVFYFVIITLSLLALTLSYFWLSVAGLLLVAGLNAAITLKRFARCGLSTLVVNYYLNAMYFFARVGSLARAIKNKKLTY